MQWAEEEEAESRGFFAHAVECASCSVHTAEFRSFSFRRLMRFFLVSDLLKASATTFFFIPPQPSFLHVPLCLSVVQRVSPPHSCVHGWIHKREFKWELGALAAEQGKGKRERGKERRSVERARGAFGLKRRDRSHCEGENYRRFEQRRRQPGKRRPEEASRLLSSTERSRQHEDHFGFSIGSTLV